MYHDESPGVQPQGWIEPVRQEVGIITGQHSKGKGSKAGQAQCCGCGVWFTVSRDAVGKYCTQDCMNAARRNKWPDWLSCSQCLCQIGIGIKLQSKILRIQKSTISRQWKRKGIKPQKPQNGSWRLLVQQEMPKPDELGNFNANWWGNYANEWMDEYHPKFITWSYIEQQERYKKRSALYQKMMYAISPKHSEFRLKRVLRTRLYSAIKRQHCVKRPRIAPRTIAMLGCTIPEFVRYIESLFQSGMTWQNHGSAWHLDHVIPLASFNLLNQSEMARACHYTNLQPLWAEDNRRKSDLLPDGTRARKNVRNPLNTKAPCN